MADICGLPPGWAKQVLDFWFSELSPRDRFSGKIEVDEMVRTRFGAWWNAVHSHFALNEPSSVTEALGAIVMLDQFSRNLFRGTAAAYSGDEVAVRIARWIIDGGLDAGLPIVARQFAYMPFMHSEDRAMQARSVDLFSRLGQPDLVGYAAHHKRIIERFGRFPHRNKVLNRALTPAETKYMEIENRF